MSRALRIVLVVLLLGGFGSSVPASAQSTVPEVYPRSGTAQLVPHGNQTVAVRPLLTVKTSAGLDALAGRLLVRLQPGVTTADLANIQKQAAALGAGAAQPLVQFAPDAYIVDVTGAASLEAAGLAFARADSRVLGVGPDYLITGTDTPNDPDLNGQWSLSTLNMTGVWNRTHGRSDRLIAILDSGIDEAHPDLAGTVVARQDFTGSATGSDDLVGHGTHVAGIAAGLTNNGIGIAGVSYSSQLLNGKVLDDNFQGSMSMLVHAIYWATDHGASVINMSLGADPEEDCNPSIWETIGETGRPVLRDAIDYAWNKNVLLVASAGNNADANPIWPASCPHVMGVANITPTGTLNSKSSRGPWVAVAAPGTDILSTAIANGKKCQTNFSGGFALCSGTSMAAPHVSGIAALVKASCGISNSQAVWDRIANTADRIDGTGVNFANGLVNPLKATCFPSPTSLRLGTITADSMVLSWTDNSPGESRFEVESEVSGSGNWGTPTVLAPNTTSTVVSGLMSTTSYDHRLRACDQFGCSDWSASVSGVTGWPRLSVSVSGAGKVTSVPLGIICGQGATTCSEQLAPNSQVLLYPAAAGTPQKGILWGFDHWEGACAGQGYPCALSMTGSRSTKAVFVRIDP